MSEIKVNSIKGVGASAAAITVNNTDGTCTANLTNRTNKNLIINGAMQVAQRGTSSTSSGYYTVDRFTIIHSVGVDESPTQAQVDVSSGTSPYTSGFRKALKVTNGNQTSGAVASAFIWIQHVIEAQDIATSGWNYTSSSSFITLSFWVKSSVAQDFKGYLRSRDGTNYEYPFATGTLTADTWTKITKTIPGNSNLTFNNDNEAGLEINLLAFLGTDRTDSGATENAWSTFNSAARTKDNTSTWYTTNDATLEVTGYQLEVGSVATDFEHRSFGQELALCQRYYFQIAKGDNKVIGHTMFFTDTDMRTAIRYPVQMRTTPSVETSNSSGHFEVKSGSGSGSGTSDSSFATFGTSPPYADTNGIVLASSVSDNNLNGLIGYVVTGHADANLALTAEL